MTFATLRALHAIIGTAIDEIESVYRPNAIINPAAAFPPVSRPPYPVLVPPLLQPPPKPTRPPRSPRRQTHLPSPPSYSPSPPPLPSRSRSPSPTLSSDCSHTIDVSALPTPISVKFAIPPKPKPKRRERAYTLPASTYPSVPRRDEKGSKILGDGQRDDDQTEQVEVLDWPDLDAPFFRPRLSPIDGEKYGATARSKKSKTEKEEDLTTIPEVINAINRIVAACAQLSACVQRPFLTLCDAAMGYHLPSCLRFLEASHTVEILRDAGPRGMHVKDIATKISQRYAPGVAHNRVDPGKLSHILRLLATHHITREVRPDVFANNRLSSFMDTGKDANDLVIGVRAESKYEGTDGIAAFMGLCSDELFKASAYLTDCYLLPDKPPFQLPISPTLASPTLPSYPIDDHHTDRHPQSSTRTHTQRPSDASSGVDGGGNARIRSWEEPLQDESPEAPQTPKTSPGQANSPSVASQASLTPPTFAPNALHARNPSLTQSLGIAQSHSQQHLSSPFSLHRQTPKLTNPLQNSSLTSLLSYHSPPHYSSASSPSHESSTNSLASLVAHSQSSSSSMLLPPVSIPTHKPSVQSLTSLKYKPSLASLTIPSHKSSISSLSSVTNVGNIPSPLAGGQLSPVREKMTPTRGKSQNFLRRIGSKSILAPAFNYSSKNGNEEREGSSVWEGGYMRGYAIAMSGFPSSPHASVSSLHSPVSMFSPRRKRHVHTTSSVSSTTHATTSSSSRLSPHSESPTSPPDQLGSNEDNSQRLLFRGHPERSRSPSPPPVPPKPMHITSNHPMHAPFNLAFRTTQPYFEWLERPENEMRLKRFGKAMTGTSEWEVPGAILDSLAWDELPPCSVVVDVGGGIGSTSMLLANAFRHLRFVVQDREPVVEMGLAAWKTRCPELLSSGQAAFQAHDFLTPQLPLPDALDLGQQPPGGNLQDEGRDLRLSSSVEDECAGNEHAMNNMEAKPPAVFLLRVITHDWPDEFVTRILLHLRNAAGPDTKLLIADHLLPLACIDEDEDEAEDSTPRKEKLHLVTPGTSEQKADKKEVLPGTIRTLAPEGSPLLPNLGKANANAYWMDLTMRVTFNSQERTLRELAALTLTAGWKVVQVSRAEGSLFGHIVAVPVDIPPQSLAMLSKVQDGKQHAGIKGSRGRTRSGTITESPVYSPPMGDTFFSRVDLPSEEIIRVQTRLSRLTRRTPASPGQKTKFGLGLGTIVASASESIMGGRKNKKGKRQRAYTVASPPRMGESPGSPIEPIPSVETQLPVPQSPRVGDGNGKKAWKTLKRMLSKPQLAAGGGSPESVGSGSRMF